MEISWFDLYILLTLLYFMVKKHIKEEASVSTESKSAFGVFGDVALLSRDQLEDELKRYQNLWSWIPENIKYLLSRVGSDVVITDRNNRFHYGFFHGFECEVLQYSVFSANVRYDEINRKPHVETGADIIFSSNVTNMKFIDSRVEQEQDKPVYPTTQNEITESKF